MCESTWHPPTALAGPMSCGPRTLGLRILPGAAFANTITTAKHEIAGLLTYLSWQSSRLSSRRAPPKPGMVQPGARVMVVRVQTCSGTHRWDRDRQVRPSLQVPAKSSAPSPQLRFTSFSASEKYAYVVLLEY